MATITKIQRRSGVRYKAVIRQGQRVVATKTFDKKADARQWARSVEGEPVLAQRLKACSSSITLNDLVGEYLVHWSESHKDLRNQMGACKWWCDRLGQKRVGAITKELIRHALDSMGSVAAATYNRRLAVLSSILRYATYEDYLIENPCSRVRKKTIRNKRERYLTADERRRLFAACDAAEWSGLGLLVRLALGTGARKSELMGLRWSDIDFKRQTAYLADTKNGDPRVLPIPTAVFDELRSRRKVGSALIFESERKPGRPMEFRKQFLAALEAAGIDDFRFHDLRHTAASVLVMAGATLHETAEVLGHRSIATTQRYAHLSDQHKAGLVEAHLGAQFSSDP